MRDINWWHFVVILLAGGAYLSILYHFQDKGDKLVARVGRTATVALLVASVAGVGLIVKLILKYLFS